MSKHYQMTIAIAAISGIIGLNQLYADDGTTIDSTSPPVHSPPIDPTFAAQLQAIEAQPTIPASTVPFRSPATFFSAQNPFWPPFPGNVNDLPLWSVGDEVYLLDDLSVDYGALLAASQPTNHVKANIIGLAQAGGPKANVTGSNPILKISPSGTNAVAITVTNGMAPENYELFWTPVLANLDYPWQAIAVGALGQTNFTVTTSLYPIGFFKVNWDTNTIPLWKAADPNNQGSGVLSVWIDSPANGAVLN